MYWREGRDREIEVLRSSILKTVFTIGRGGEKKIRLYSPRSGRYQQSTPFDETEISLDSFVHKIAEKIWKHQQHTKDSNKNDLLEATRNEIKGELDNFQQILRASKCKFTETTIKQVMKILARDAERVFNPKHYTKDVKEFLQFNALAQGWIERENALIEDIRVLFREYKPFGKNDNDNSDHQISYSISKIFEASNLWLDKKARFETMRKRLQEIDDQKKLSQQKS